MSLSKPNIIQGIKPRSGTIPLPKPNVNNNQNNPSAVLSSYKAILEAAIPKLLNQFNDSKDIYLKWNCIKESYQWVKDHVKRENGNLYLKLEEPSVDSLPKYYGAVYNNIMNGKQCGITKLSKADINITKELVKSNSEWRIINIQGGFYKNMNYVEEKDILGIPSRLLKTPLYTYLEKFGVGIEPFYSENENFHQCYFKFEKEIEFLNQIIGEENYCILQGDARIRFKDDSEKHPKRRFTCCLYLDILGNLGVGFFEADCNIGPPDVTICSFCQRYLLSEMFPLFSSVSGEDDNKYILISSIKSEDVKVIQPLIEFSSDLVACIRKPKLERIEEIPAVKRQFKDGHLEEIKEIEDIPKNDEVIIEEP